MRYRIVFIKSGLKKVPQNYHQKTINHLTKDDYETIIHAKILKHTTTFFVLNI